MSHARYLIDEPASPVPYARCPRRACEIYVARGKKKEPGEQKEPSWLWLGDQRGPARPDERGALYVIDLVFGGRIALHAISGDSKHLRVEQLP